MIFSASPDAAQIRALDCAALRTRDGHMVRSSAEVIIDNALYENKLAHTYERKLPMKHR